MRPKDGSVENEMLNNKNVKDMTPEERRERLKLVFKRVMERNGDAITKLSKD